MHWISYEVKRKKVLITALPRLAEFLTILLQRDEIKELFSSS